MSNTTEKNIKDAYEKLFVNTCNNYIFIYTPPKVGSTTLVSSLRISLGKSYNVIHIHDDIMLNVLTGLNVKVNDIISYIAKLGKQIFVIDVYRSPIERKMSEYFEKLSPYHFNNTDENISKYNVTRIISRFNKLFPYLATEEHYFDKYNIENPILFDFNRKYTIQTINGVNYIKLRLLDTLYWSDILTEVLKTKIVIIDDYQTKNKPICALYSAFKEQYKLPINYYEMIKQDKYFLFYYSEEERNKYLNEWNKKLGGHVLSYTRDQYDFYVVLYLENQFYNDIQIDHYIDNGCFCNGCCEKRRHTYYKALKGEQITEKIIHSEVVTEKIINNNNKIINTIKAVNSVNQAIKTLNHKHKKIMTIRNRTFGLNI